LPSTYSKDRPDIHARVLAGEITAHAAQLASSCQLLLLGGHLLGRGGGFSAIFGGFSAKVRLHRRVMHPQRLCGAAPARSAPDDPADLDAEGEEQHQQREHGDGHQPSVTSKAQFPNDVCGAPSAP
jgi:hypothetical protein